MDRAGTRRGSKAAESMISAVAHPYESLLYRVLAHSTQVTPGSPPAVLYFAMRPHSPTNPSALYLLSLSPGLFVQEGEGIMERKGGKRQGRVL